MPIRLTPAVKALLVACFAMFIVQQTADQFMGADLLGSLGLVPSSFVFDFKIWQIFTYAFLHADVMHLFLNLLMLAFIGGELEATWGTRRFLGYYFLCSVGAGIFYLLLQVFVTRGSGLHTPMVGASGAIYGLLMAYGLIFGERVLLFMMLFPMKAKHFVWILAGVEFMSAVFSGHGGLANIAHLGGMAVGFGYLWIRAAFRVAQKNRAQKASGVQRVKRIQKEGGHLKLIIDNDRDTEKPGLGRTGKDGGPKTWH